MTSEDKKKSVAKRARQAKSNEPLWCAAMHETNIALCLASGYLLPRTEPSAALDHHNSIGGLCVYRGSLPEYHLVGAKGDLGYGATALIELELPDELIVVAEDSASAVAFLPVPITCLKRILFSTENEAQEFLARLAGYADVPQDIVTVGVDSERFNAIQGCLIPNLQSDIATAFSSAKCTNFDKAMGAICCVLSAAGGLNAQDAESVIRSIINTSPDDIAVNLIRDIVKTITPADEAGEMTLALAAATTYAGIKINDGLSPSQFLGDLVVNATSENGGKAHVERFAKFAGEVLSAKRELVEDAFSDVVGKIVARALLLSLLHQDIEKLELARNHIPTIGTRVYLLASAFVGLLSGLTSLPISVKAPSSAYFLSVIDIGSHILLRKSQSVVRETKWSPDGKGKTRIRVGIHVVTESSVMPHPFFNDIYATAKELGISPQFEENSGELTLLVLPNREERVTVRLSESLSVPRRIVSELFFKVGGKKTKREAALCAANINLDYTHGRVFAGLVEVGKSFVTEVSIQVEDGVSRESLISGLSSLGHFISAKGDVLEKIHPALVEVVVDDLVDPV